MKETITLAMAGASGAPYGLRLLECLLAAEHRVYFTLSKPAQVVLGLETELELPARPAQMQRYLAARFRAAEGQLRVFGREEWTAPIASGSGAPRRMVIAPCTTATLGAVAAGVGRDLIERAADVVLKERGTLILVPRETPYSTVHLENMLRLSRAGAVVLPANPAFYHRPQTVEDLVDFVVARILDHLGVAHTLLPRWGAGDEA